ncbi:unnamed protein product [Anisakis simplex]|uniref:Uncharacterized protein n=1 Tax=Anisakis simplex TaxID=6269 RepID=A0A3P6UIM7_ANISI|nr:unnamed protein product [Anisakis simplex]
MSIKNEPAKKSYIAEKPDQSTKTQQDLLTSNDDPQPSTSGLQGLVLPRPLPKPRRLPRVPQVQQQQQQQQQEQQQIVEELEEDNDTNIKNK